MMEMPERIRAARKQAGLNQAEFGAKVGVKGNTIGNYELGIRNPSDAVIFSICREFGISENWLRAGEGEMKLPTSRDEELTEFLAKIMVADDSDFPRKFVSILARLDTEHWKLIADIAEELAQKKE